MYVSEYAASGKNASVFIDYLFLFFTKIGLLPNMNVPSLVSSLVPQIHSVSSRRFIEKWLRLPPPYDIADSMQALCCYLFSHNVTLPLGCISYPVGKIVQLVTKRLMWFSFQFVFFIAVLVGSVIQRYFGKFYFLLSNPGNPLTCKFTFTLGLSIRWYPYVLKRLWKLIIAKFFHIYWRLFLTNQGFKQT